MKGRTDIFSWHAISLLGIDDNASAVDHKRFRVYNQLVAISLLTYLLFIPIAALIESMYYFLVLITSILILTLCLWFSYRGHFLVSMVLFMLTLIVSIMLWSIHLGQSVGIYLSLIPISILPLLFVRNKQIAIIPLFFCIVFFLCLQLLWEIVVPFPIDDWKEILLLNAIVVGIVIVSYFYNEFFRISTDENDAKHIFMNREISVRNEHILDNVKLAREIQANLLPDDGIMKRFFPKSFVMYKPRDIVSGDFYWIDEKDGKQYCGVIDCTGHGVPGAFVSIIGHQALQRSINNFGLREPADILNKLHELMFAALRKEDSNITDGMDMSLICIDRVKMKMSFSGANTGLLLVRDMEKPMDGFEPELRGVSRLMYKVNPQRQSVGSEFLKEDFTQVEFDLEKQDSIYIYTDGYIDQFGGPHFRKLMHNPLRKLIMEVQDKEIQDQKKAFQMYFDNWQGDTKQVDDVCVIGIQV